MKEIYVGNLRFDTTLDEVRELFAMFGTIYSVDLHTERTPGKPHAYAFVVMDTQAAHDAIAALDCMDYFGQTLKVEEAQVVVPA
ncbi:RNA-binding protein [Chloroflexi bacterium TSY]|nr:RNA-binding protein [Chloroflexi bacterium TSY]